jgi:hypothetical protein
MTPQQKKYAIYGTVAVVAIAATIYLLKRDRGGSSLDPTGNGNVIPDNGTFDPLTVANSLWKAMKDTGTDENKIFATLKNVTQDQFALVIQKFGMLKYNPLTGSQLNLNPFSELKRYSLPEWLEYELSESSYETLRLKYPKYL